MDLICIQTSVASLRNFLATLPETYEKAYKITFDRILQQPATIVDLSKRPQFDVALSCLTYLDFEEFSLGPCSSVGDLQARLGLMPFLGYCARSWGLHVRQFQKALMENITDVLGVAPLREAIWQVLQFVC